MPTRRSLRITPPVQPPLDVGFPALRAELGAPETFPEAVLAEAEAAATAASPPSEDATSVELVTIDPPGSRDLDQALHIAAGPDGGWRVSYAIADVAAFVRPGGALDAEAHARGATLYMPDRRIPLHPPVLSEGAASLLPDQERRALLWTIDVAIDGTPTSTHVRRAMVRSRRQFDYRQVQVAIDDGSAPESLGLLRKVGTALVAAERARGGVDLDLLDQEVVAGRDGRWALHYRASLPVETWNAQISLLTGMAAAQLMLKGGVGILRTLPAPDARTIDCLRRSVNALGMQWPESMPYAEFLGSLRGAVPLEAAVLELSTQVLRGAGYVSFDGELPADPVHGAVAAPYAHVTAPLRRLVDRYAGEACLALCAGRPVPEWVRAALPSLPEQMAAADRKAHAVDRAVVNLVEACVLAGRVGETFAGVIVEAGKDGGEVQLAEPAVRGRVRGTGLPVGVPVTVRLVEADPAKRAVTFGMAEAGDP